MGLFEFLGNLFGTRSIPKVPLYTLRKSIMDWSTYRRYPTYTALPSGLSFSPEFWTRVKEIARHTLGDGHERAINVWWADGEFVLTESIRGSETAVNIPRQVVIVNYKPLTATKGERIITVDNKVYSKRSVDMRTIPRNKKIEVQFLLNMHTHPPTGKDQEGKNIFPFFSAVDINMFVSSPACLTGLVLDELWILAKTDRTVNSGADITEPITIGKLIHTFHIKPYRALFTGGAMEVRVEEPGSKETGNVNQ